MQAVGGIELSVWVVGKVGTHERAKKDPSDYSAPSGGAGLRIGEKARKISNFRKTEGAGQWCGYAERPSKRKKDPKDDSAPSGGAGLRIGEKVRKISNFRKTEGAGQWCGYAV